MACNTDLLCCGNNNFATPQQFYFANIALLCAIRDAVAAGGGSTNLEYIWELCFQYLPEGAEDLVVFTRRFTENLETHVVTTYDYDKLTGLPVIVPEGVTLVVCPSCCDETNELLQNLVDPNADIPWTMESFGEEDITSNFIVLPAPGIGSRYQIRYFAISNAGQADTFDLSAASSSLFIYTIYLVVGAIYATRFNKDDYGVLDDNEALGITPWNSGSDNMNITVEYRIVPV